MTYRRRGTAVDEVRFAEAVAAGLTNAELAARFGLPRDVAVRMAAEIRKGRA